MRASLYTICGIAAGVLVGVSSAGCAGKAGYSPPPERRAGERCPVGETLVCRDQYPSRLPDREDDPLICYCDNIPVSR
jgi:hypothetical protein